MTKRNNRFAVASLLVLAFDAFIPFLQPKIHGLYQHFLFGKPLLYLGCIGPGSTSKAT